MLFWSFYDPVGTNIPIFLSFHAILLQIHALLYIMKKKLLMIKGNTNEN